MFKKHLSHVSPHLLGKYLKYNFVLNESSFVQSYDVSHIIKCLGCSFPNFTLQLAPDAMSPWHSITLTACPISQFTRRPPTNESAVCSLATNQRPGGRGRAWQLNFPQLTLQQLSCRQCSPRTDAAAATNMLHNLWTKTVSLHASYAAWPGLPSLPSSEAKG